MLFETPVEEPDLHVGLADHFSVQAQFDADDAVHGRMGRSRVQQHGPGGLSHGAGFNRPW